MIEKNLNLKAKVIHKLKIEEIFCLIELSRVPDESFIFINNLL